MKVRCPACGATMSLDVLIAHDDARATLIVLTGISDDLVKAMLKYLTLFRPSEKDLSFNRVSKLLGELVPMIQAEKIVRNRQEYDAPRAAWIWAANRCLEARDAGRLKTPLTTHGFLLENLTFWTPDKTVAVADLPAVSQASAGDVTISTKLRQGVNALSQWAGSDWLRQEIAAGFAVLSAMNLKGRPAAQDLAVLAGLWEQRLLERIVAVEGTQFVEELDRPRIQTAFKALQDVSEWPNVIELIRNLPPRLIPRAMLEKPKPDRAKGRDALAKMKQSLSKSEGK